MNTGDLLNNTYRLQAPLGKGGLGTIYLAYHENLRKYVVIKRIKDNCRELVNVRAEADILKSLHHRFLPQVYDFIESEDGIYTVMDYIEGHDLKYYMDSGCAFDEKTLVYWLKQLCDVLDYLHTRPRPIIHCDIKPANIMITPAGDVCLIDFNISLDGENNKELTGLSSSYASPEQFRRAMAKLKYGRGDFVPIDARSDIYSLGAVFYEIVSGVRPNVRREDYVRLDVLEHTCGSALANIIDKAMEENPGRRFKNAAKFKEALEHIERWESSFKRLQKAGFILDIGFWTLGLLLVCGMIVGYGQDRRERFFKQYEQCMEAAEVLFENEDSENAQEIFKLCTALLNDESQRRTLEKYPGEKANLLKVSGMAALGFKAYEEAAEMLEEASELDSDDAGIYRELSIAYTGAGRPSRAEKAMDKALSCGMSEADAALVAAAAAMEAKDYESAYSHAVEASKSEEAAVWERAAYIAVKSADELGNASGCVYFAARTAEKKEGTEKIFWQKTAGEAAVKAEIQIEKEAVAVGISCLEAVIKSGLASFEDYDRLVYLYEKTEKLEAAQKLLTEMKGQFPDEYTVFMQLSYIQYRLENDKMPAERDYKTSSANCEKAKKCCERAGINWKNDESMVQLNAIFESLEQQGWPLE